MSNRRSTHLHKARNSTVAAMLRAEATDRRQPVSLATWRVYAAILSDDEMQRNFRIAAFSKPGD